MNRGRAKRALLLALCVLGLLLFSALGVWQVERLAWKLDLIERVNARVAAPAGPLPSLVEQGRLRGRDVEYRHVRARGAFLHDRETLVDALTERGPGYWVVTPLRTDTQVVLVNRGFVPPERARPGSRAAGETAGPVEVDGLIRLTEPGGRVLRPNAPQADRWYSRDVAAIARARHLGRVAPYFLDAGASPNPGGYPIGGLTVVTFRNAHLMYAITWFGLALLCLVGLVMVVRQPQDDE